MYYVKLTNTKNEKEVVLEFESKVEAMESLQDVEIPECVEVIHWDESYEDMFIKSMEEYVAHFGIY